MKRILAVFMKYPQPGQVKTRMIPRIGEAGAAAAYCELLTATLQSLPQTGYDIWIAYTPKDRQLGVAAWLCENVPGFRWSRLVPQDGADLGARLWNVVRMALEVEKAASVTLIGTDCPRIRPEHFAEAQDLLENGCEVVFGPAHDGGYYLQALTSAKRELFFGIPWSSSKTLAACLERVRFLGLKAGQLEALGDVDTADDWQRWQKEMKNR